MSTTFKRGITSTAKLWEAEATILLARRSSSPPWISSITPPAYSSFTSFNSFHWRSYCQAPTPTRIVLWCSFLPPLLSRKGRRSPIRVARCQNTSQRSPWQGTPGSSLISWIRFVAKFVLLNLRNRSIRPSGSLVSELSCSQPSWHSSPQRLRRILGQASRISILYSQKRESNPKLFPWLI